MTLEKQFKCQLRQDHSLHQLQLSMQKLLTYRLLSTRGTPTMTQLPLRSPLSSRVIWVLSVLLQFIVQVGELWRHLKTTTIRNIWCKEVRCIYSMVKIFIISIHSQLDFQSTTSKQLFEKYGIFISSKAYSMAALCEYLTFK